MKSNITKTNKRINTIFYGVKITSDEGYTGKIMKCRYCYNDTFTNILVYLIINNKKIVSFQPFCNKCKKHHFQLNINEAGLKKSVKSITEDDYLKTFNFKKTEL